MSESCPPPEILYALATDDEASPEVRQHVAACAACRQQVAEVENQTTTMRQIVAAPASPLAPAAGHPSAIGKYVIVGVLSDDSDAVCYRGLHSVLHVEVSILVGKTFKAPSPQEQEPLISTARPLLAVEHPGIARLRDLGFQDGTPYLVHDYVSGQRLGRWPPDRPIPLAAAVQGGEQILTALAELHRRGLPHGRLSVRSMVAADNGRLSMVDLGRAWLSPAQPIGNDSASAAEILRRLLSHVPPAERGGKYSALVEVCRQVSGRPLTMIDFCDRWRKGAGLSPSATGPLLMSLLIGGITAALFIALMLVMLALRR